MFRRLLDASENAITFEYDGKPISACQGDTLAAALLAVGVVALRTTPVFGAPRAPYCMMGVCFDCLVTVDGIGNRQSCLVEVRSGMKVQSQQGKRDVQL
ncbi:MAG: hypothetical protein QOG67_1001 [Verrucomicrobiota bacterium]|jgi:hypothetical protein